MFRFLAASRTVTELVCDCTGDASMRIGYTVDGVPNPNSIVSVDSMYDYGTSHYKQLTATLPAGTEIYKMCIVGSQGISSAKVGGTCKTSYNSPGVTGSLSVTGTFLCVDKYAVSGLAGIGVLEQSFTLPVTCKVTVTANGYYELYWHRIKEKQTEYVTYPYPTDSASIAQFTLGNPGDSLSAYTTDKIKGAVNQIGPTARSRHRLNGSASVVFTVDAWSFPFIATRSSNANGYEGGKRGILYNQELTGAATWNEFMIDDASNGRITDNIRALGSKLRDVMLNHILGKYPSDFLGCSGYEPTDTEYSTASSTKTEHGTRVTVVNTASSPVPNKTLKTISLSPFIPYFPANKQTVLSSGIKIKGTTYFRAAGTIADSPRLTTSLKTLVNINAPTNFNTYAYLQYGVTTYG